MLLDLVLPEVVPQNLTEMKQTIKTFKTFKTQVSENIRKCLEAEHEITMPGKQSKSRNFTRAMAGKCDTRRPRRCTISICDLILSGLARGIYELPLCE